MAVKPLFLAGGLLLLVSYCTPSLRQRIRWQRQEYREQFLTNPQSPLTNEDLPYLSFFKPDPHYRVTADLALTPEAEPFDMATFDGGAQTYVSYAVATFRLQGRTFQLRLYRNLRLARLPAYRDRLFLPFRDLTNGETTYGGGRYLDFRLDDIHNGRLLIDFNRAYNPYCAYSDGYQCPVPPAENHLDIAIEAGEKMFYRPESKAH